MDVDHQVNKENLSSEELLKLYKIKKTVIKMIEDRGYVNHSETKSESFEEFKAKFTHRKNLGILGTTFNSTQTIYVEFSDKEKLGVEQIKNFWERIKDDNIHNGIIISKGGVTSLCKNALSEYQEIDYHIEIFEEKELIVNITEHELVPKHLILHNDEKDALLKKYKLKENQLPKILLSDPIAKYLGLKRFQVVKIIRPSETAGKYITYRIAV